MPPYIALLDLEQLARDVAYEFLRDNTFHTEPIPNGGIMFYHHGGYLGTYHGFLPDAQDEDTFCYKCYLSAKRRIYQMAEKLRHGSWAVRVEPSGKGYVQLYINDVFAGNFDTVTEALKEVDAAYADALTKGA